MKYNDEVIVNNTVKKDFTNRSSSTTYEKQTLIQYNTMAPLIRVLKTQLIFLVK